MASASDNYIIYNIYVCIYRYICIYIYVFCLSHRFESQTDAFDPCKPRDAHSPAPQSAMQCILVLHRFTGLRKFLQLFCLVLVSRLDLHLLGDSPLCWHSPSDIWSVKSISLPRCDGSGQTLWCLGQAPMVFDTYWYILIPSAWVVKYPAVFFVLLFLVNCPPWKLSASDDWSLLIAIYMPNLYSTSCGLEAMELKWKPNQMLMISAVLDLNTFQIHQTEVSH